jgi:putative tryptophan/tyrosine transport system substrate-binding protein
MDRRVFLAVAAAGVVARPAVARAQQPAGIHRLGVLSLRSGPDETDEAFVQGLRELGHVEGRSVAIEYRWGGGKAERLPEMAAELVRLKVDLIVSQGTLATEAAKRATSSVPIVFVGVGDPVGSGLVASMGRPGGNVTGFTILSTELAGKRLHILRELLPRASRVALLVHRPASPTPLLIREMRTAGQQLGIQITAQEIDAAVDLPSAFAAMQRERAQALVVQQNPITTEHARRIAELAAQHRLPAIYYRRDFVEAGGLMSYGTNAGVIYRRAATYVDKILKGAKPADLPVEQPTTFEFVINLKTAKALGLTIPPALLVRADQAIQ